MEKHEIVIGIRKIRFGDLEFEWFHPFYLHHCYGDATPIPAPFDFLFCSLVFL